MNNKYGYKGIKTSLNGLTNYIYNARSKNKLVESCNRTDIYYQHLKDIIQFGIENIEGFQVQNPQHLHLHNHNNLIKNAEYVAIYVQNNKKFIDFKKWYESKFFSDITTLAQSKLVDIFNIDDNLDNQ